MGNSPSAHSDSSSGSAAEEVVQSNTVTAGASASSSAASSGELLSSPTKPNFRGTFNPHISIETLGSGGPGDDAGAYYNLENPTSNNVGLGAALVGGGGGANNNNNIAGSGDVILSSLPKDLSLSNLGGQIVAIQRLLPGSGRMMRSYRIRVRVNKIDNGGATSAANQNTSASNNTAGSDNNNRSKSGVSTIELACKSFIVRSERVKHR